MTEPGGRHRLQEPRETYPLEPKVKAAVGGVVGGAGAVAPFLLYLIDVWLFGGGEFDVPLQVVGFVEFVVGGAFALAAGWIAPHVDRAG